MKTYVDIGVIPSVMAVNGSIITMSQQRKKGKDLYSTCWQKELVPRANMRSL